MIQTTVSVHPSLRKRMNGQTNLYPRSWAAVPEGLLPTRYAFHFAKNRQDARELTEGQNERF